MLRKGNAMASQTMVETIDHFFELAVVRGHSDPMLRRTSGSCRFDIISIGSWLVRADNGTLTVNAVQSSTPADSTLTANEDDFLRMTRGQQSPLTAFMQGRLQVTGNLALAERFTHLFP
jgi:predicted lipid carrier protein YhbT